MAYELKDGQGSFFKNDKKGNEKAPDYRGELNIGGTTYKLAGWIKDGQRGKWMSLKVEPKDEQAEVKRIGKPADADDAIPF